MKTLIVLALVACGSCVLATGAACAEPRAIQLEELWRIGGPRDEDNLIGVVDRALADDEGNVYLLDIQLVEVQVYDRDGRYVRSLGKLGDGPGELRRAMDLVFLGDGTVGIIQPFPGRIVKVALDGTPAGEIRPGGDDPTRGGFFNLTSAAALGDRLVLGAIRSTRDDDAITSRHFLGDFTAGGVEQAAYVEKTASRGRGTPRIVETDRWFPHRLWALAPDGRLYVAPGRNEYRIEVYSAAGDPERVISRDYESWVRTAEETARARRMLAPRRFRNREVPETVVDPTEPDIADLRIAPDGSLWVLTSRGLRNQPDGVHSTWDVFDPAGEFTGRVGVACEGRGEEDALLWTGTDLVVLVKQHASARAALLGGGGDVTDQEGDGDAAPLEIICYRMQP